MNGIRITQWDNAPVIQAILALKRALEGEIPRDIADDINDLLNFPEKLFTIEPKRDAAPKADEFIMCFYPSDRLLMVLTALGIGADELHRSGIGNI